MRRSSFRTTEVKAHHIFLSPYRCRDCGERFWVVSRHAYLFAAIIGVALLVGAIGWSVYGLIAASNVDRPPSALNTPFRPELAKPPPGPELAKLAESNDAAAEYELARAHASGDGVAKNEKEAWKWLERSARNGNTQAQYELAIVLREGRGTLQDYEGARFWMLKAAEGGHPQAQYDLGVMYRLGNGVAVDNVKAYIWLNLAAAQGVPGAAPLRDATLSRLSPSEVAEGQTESKRLSETNQKAPTALP